MNVSEKWKFPKKGDLVVSIDDRERGIELVGLVTESGRKRRDKIKKGEQGQYIPNSH